MIYEIKLPQFEGPFDLLLFFIERDELDIYDIPISKITDEFLEYMRQMQALNLDVASEFILVAATLMKIKSKMLLPRKELDEMGEEIDPRQELVDRLLEYKKYKELIAEFKEMEEIRQSRVKRGNVLAEMEELANLRAGEAELDNLSLYRLMLVFQKVITRLEEKQEIEHTVIKYEYTLDSQKNYLVGILKEKDRSGFEELFAICENKTHAIFTFLALLELVQQDILSLRIGEGFNNFWISRGSKYEEEGTT